MYKCFRLKKFVGLALICSVIVFSFIGLAVSGFRYVAVVNVEQAEETNNEVQQTVKKKEEIFIPVIMYHSLLKDTSRQGDYVLDPDVFIADMEYLKQNGYTTIFTSDILNFIDNDTQLPDKPVLVTFDDGYYNVMYYAYPYLKENNMKAVMSVVGNYTGKAADEDEHNPQYSNLTWDEITELAESGVFEIGNHTYDMHSLDGRKGSKKLSSESYEDYRKVLFDDVGSLQGLLQDKVGITPDVFAYPFGFISDDSVSILSDIGFKVLFTCYEKPNYITNDNEYPLVLNRYNRPCGISTEKFMEKVLDNS